MSPFLTFRSLLRVTVLLFSLGAVSVFAPTARAGHTSDEELVTLMFYGGGAVFVGSISYDILYGAPKSARLYNAAHPAKEGIAVKQKSPLVASLWSLGCMAIPVAVGTAVVRTQPGTRSEGNATMLIVGGLFLGPSAGHDYAAQARRGLNSASVRVLATAVMLTAVFAAFSDFD